MKRLLLLLIPLVLVFGCSDTSDLEARLAALEAENTSLKEVTQTSTPTPTSSTPVAVTQVSRPTATETTSSKVVDAYPYQGTVWDPFSDVINSEDPSTFLGIAYSGKESRQMYDRRQNDWIQDTPHLFIAQYSDKLTIEVQVNSEFEDLDIARKIAFDYAWQVGQLPKVLRKGVKTLWIHDGKHPFGGGNENILIHVEQGKEYASRNLLEEVFIHEAAHTSLNWPEPLLDHGKTPGWLIAQESDEGFISAYAKQHPQREDIAESFLPWFALRYRLDRISKSDQRKILEAIPHRLKYFDAQNFAMYPVTANN